MRKWCVNGLCILVAGAMTIFAVGCGDDDDKGNGSSGLTEEEQFEIINQYFSFDPDGQSDAVDVTSYVLGLLSGQYWDGIDTADVVSLGKRVAPMAKLIANPADAESLYVDYNFVSGWWVIYYEVSVADEFSEFGVTARDSVRFADAEGDPQFEPDETTNRIDMVSAVSGSITGLIQGLAAGEGDHLLLETESASRFAVTRAGLTSAQVDGAADIGLFLDAALADTSVTLSFDLDAGYDQLVIPITAFQGEVCPTSGEVAAGMDIAVTVAEGDDQAEAEGSWDASIEFTGDGIATLHVESGDFSEDFTGQACVPPQQ